MKINLGSGYKRIDGYVNVDSNPRCKPDCICDIAKEPLPFLNDSVQEIMAHHILEHIDSTEDYFFLFKEMYRVCKHEAILDIKVPHHRSEVWYGDPSHRRFVTVDNLRLFDRNWNSWYLDKWQSSTGFGELLGINFTIIEYDFSIDDYWKERFSKMTEEERYFVLRSYNNVAGETVVKMMAIKSDE